MSQATAAIANMSRTLFRAAVNAVLQALQSMNAGAAAPSETYAYMPWADETSGWLKQRNAADSGWIFVRPLAGRAEVDVAAAATVDLGAQVSDFVRITGTGGPITSFGAAGAGRVVDVRFSAAPTLTHNASSLILPGGDDIVCAAGDSGRAVSLGGGNWRITAYTRASGRAVIATTSVLRAYLAGLALSTAGTSATMTAAAGSATDSTNAVSMSLTSAMAKTTSAWAAGTGNGGLDTGAIANSTWYHWFLIGKTDGTTDVLCSLSPSAPTMPASYNYLRRIGSGKTDGSAQWVKFSQRGDHFQWDATATDWNVSNQGAAAVTRAIAVPTGVPVEAILRCSASDNTSVSFLVSSLSMSDEAVTITNAQLMAQLVAGARADSATEIRVLTDTSARIRTRASAGASSQTFTGRTVGWIDRRGRDE